MRKVLLGSLVGVAALVLALALPSAGYAQGFWGGEIDRASRPGPYTPYDGAGFSYRYNFEFGPAFYPGYNSANFAHLEYLDRLERQQNFGHLWHSRKHGSEWQVERIQREYWFHTYGRYGSGCWRCDW